MASQIGVSVGVTVGDSTVEKRSAFVFAGVSFILGVVVGWGLRGLRIAYLKRKHEFLKRHMKKTESALMR